MTVEGGSADSTGSNGNVGSSSSHINNGLDWVAFIMIICRYDMFYEVFQLRRANLYHSKPRDL